MRKYLLHILIISLAFLSMPVLHSADDTSGIELVFVKGGCFDMGDTFGDGRDDEIVHEVCLDDFYIGKYEVTQGEWEEIMEDNPSKDIIGNNYPVEHTTWYEAQEFIKKLNQKTGQNYRLPTEAEWEYAARSGGKKEKYAGTSSESSLGQYAWHADNSGNNPHPVGTKSPNGLGIYDMSGSVWEWCQDIFSADAYIKHQRNNPIYTGSGSRRVGRGGCFGHPPSYASTSRRWDCPPVSRHRGLGFRLARTP